MDPSQTSAVPHEVKQSLGIPAAMPGMPLNVANELFEQNEWWPDLIGGNTNEGGNSDESSDTDESSNLDEGSNFVEDESEWSLDTEPAAIVDVPIRQRVQRMARENIGYAEDLGQITMSVTDASKDLQCLTILEEIAVGKRSCHVEALTAVLLSSDFKTPDLRQDRDDAFRFTIERTVRKTIERLIQVQRSKTELEESLLRKLNEKDRELSEANGIIRKRVKSDELVRSKKRKPEEEPAEADRPFKKT